MLNSVFAPVTLELCRVAYSYTSGECRRTLNRNKQLQHRAVSLIAQLSCLFWVSAGQNRSKRGCRTSLHGAFSVNALNVNDRQALYESFGIKAFREQARRNHQ